MTRRSTRPRGTHRTETDPGVKLASMNRTRAGESARHGSADATHCRRPERVFEEDMSGNVPVANSGESTDPSPFERLDVSKVGTLPETEPERTIALAERLSVLLGLPAPEGRWRYLRDVG